MRRLGIVVAVIALFSISFAVRHFWLSDAPATAVDSKAKHERIVVLAPSTVEIVYALGLGDKVVGVSEFTRYPEAAAAKPKVGGYTNLDMEALLRLEPDTVVLLESQDELETKLRKLGMQTIRVNHMSVNGIQDSIMKIASFLGATERGIALVAGIKQRKKVVQERASAQNRKPVVLVSIGREGGLGSVKKLVAAGAKGYHQELILLAGGENGYRGVIPFPSLTREHLLRMNPDVIIDLFPSKEFNAVGKQKLLEDWKSLPELKAVRDGKVFVVGEDMHYIPGPRFIDTLEWLQQCISSSDE